MLYNFGPFLNPDLEPETVLYIFVMMFMFISTYSFGLGTRKNLILQPAHENADTIHRILFVTSIMTFVGAGIILFDRISSGAASIDLVVNSIESLRDDDYMRRLTPLTAVGVIPQSFRLVAFASYFYSMMNKFHISIIIHALFMGIMTIDLLTMLLTASRGMLFWLGTYWIFYVIFCRRISIIKTIFSYRYMFAKVVAFSLIAVSFWFFYYVSRNRSAEAYLKVLGDAAIEKNNISAITENLDSADLGALYSLTSYVTSEFEYINACVKHSEWIAFNPVAALGIRVTSQLSKIWPAYTPAAKILVNQWIAQEGLSPAGWVSIFGVTLACFGIIGSAGFYSILGLLCGKCTRMFIRTNNFSWFIFIFLIFVSFNLSFDWIIRDFEQYNALMFAFILLAKARHKNSAIPI